MKRVDNKSGITGVSWDTENNKWQSRISINGKSVRLGRFSNIEDAISDRIEAEKQHWYYDFHKGNISFNENAQNELKKIINYDPLTGIFTWNATVNGHVRKGCKAGSIRQHETGNKYIQ